MPAVDRGAAQDGGEHGFAGSGRADEQHVGRVGEVGACGEFPHEFFVDAGLGGEVEVFELPGGGEVREPHAAGPPSLFGGFDLDPQELLEEVGMTNVALACLVEMGWESFGPLTAEQGGERSPDTQDRTNTQRRMQQGESTVRGVM